jgi:hypothetical protein
MKDPLATVPRMRNSREWARRVRKGVCKSAHVSEGITAHERDWSNPNAANVNEWFTDTNSFRIVRNK